MREVYEDLILFLLDRATEPVTFEELFFGVRETLRLECKGEPSDLKGYVSEDLASLLDVNLAWRPGMNTYEITPTGEMKLSAKAWCQQKAVLIASGKRPA